jgi:hypothetical protein
MPKIYFREGWEEKRSVTNFNTMSRSVSRIYTASFSPCLRSLAIQNKIRKTVFCQYLNENGGENCLLRMMAGNHG